MNIRNLKFKHYCSKPKALNFSLRSKNIVTKLLASILMLAFILLPVHAMALTSAELQRQKQYYAEQAAAAKAAAAQKAQEAALVKNQISNIDGQIDQTASAITQTSTQINDTASKIADLEAQIKVQEDNMNQEKEKMHRVIVSWYMEGDNGGLFESVLGSNSLSEVTTKEQYYESIRQEINGMIDQINKLKADLKIQKDEQESQKSTLEAMKSDQQARQKSLESNMAYKNQLLNYTNSTITDLKNQEAAAQARITQINAQISALSSTSRWGDQIVSSNDSSWYFAQTGNQTHLGDSPYTVSQYGCLITSIAMLSRYYGGSATPSSIASNTGNFDNEGYLLVSSPFGTGVNVGGSQSVNWDTVDEEIGNGHPVIVSIYLPTVGAVNRDGSSHFIVIKGKSGSQYLMHDPIGNGRGYNISQVRSMKIVRSQ